jgi:hypothetical protein
MAPSTPIFLPIKSPADFSALLAPLNIASETVIVKPAWFSPHPGTFTEAEVLDAVLSALPRQAHKVVVEGYSGERNDGSRRIDLKDQKKDWAWIAEQDYWFRDTYGFSELFRKHKADYLSVTEEVWSGRVAPAADVAGIVEQKGPPIAHSELYAQVPLRLWELRGSTFISLAKIKGGFSLSIKNLFGLIAEPLRLSYHGKDGESLSRSIADIARIYFSLFDMVGVCEAAFNSAIYRPGGTHSTSWGEYDLVRSPAVAGASRNLLALDASIARVFGREPQEVDFLQMLSEAYGPLDEGEIAQTAQKTRSLFAKLLVNNS